MNTEEIRRALQELKQEVIRDPHRVAEEIRQRPKSDWSEFFVNGGIPATTNELFQFLREGQHVPKSSFWAMGRA